MKYKYGLPSAIIKKAENLKEFANGAAQVSVLLNNGETHHQILISDGQYIVAMRNETDLPFDPNNIVDIFQQSEDENPQNKGGWNFWDDWS